MEGAGERGLPFPSEHYAPSEYGADPQNWAVAQDERGVTYVANNAGILQYDGERWRLIPTATGRFVRSLAVDSVVFVGAKGDFGVLRPDSSGVLRYRSLYKQATGPRHSFKDVWNTHVTPEGTYFQTNEWLFRWDGERIDSWKSTERFHTSFTLGNRLYVRESGRGLLRMENDSLVVVPGGRAFSKTPIYMMAPHPSGAILIATQNKGLQLYDDGTLRSLAPKLTAYLDQNDLYDGSRLPGNRYALATLGGGVLVVGANGRLLRVLDASAGLPDEVVNAVYAGRHGQLWMALNNDGVYRADVGSTTTLHDERTGLEGTVRRLHRHRGTLYVATGQGLYVLKHDNDSGPGPGQGRFEKRTDLPITWDLLSVGDTLLAATETGTYRIDEGARQQITGNHSYVLSKAEDGGAHVGTRSGITGLKRSSTGWESFAVEGTEREIRSLARGSNGGLWASTVDGTILYYRLSGDGHRVVARETFGEESELPVGYKSLTTVRERVTVFSQDGLFRVQNPQAAPSDWHFGRRASLLPDPEGADTLSVRAVGQEEDTLWVALGNRVYRGQRTAPDSSYTWSPVEPLHVPKTGQTSLHVDGDGVVWLGTGQRLIRYAPNSGRTANRREPVFRALVRRVTTLRNDRIVYGGAPESLGPDSALTLPYLENSLRFEVAAPFYRTTDSHQYQYKLAGHSDEWSEWRRQPSATYTQLWEGTYRFRVRARNDRGEISQAGMLVLHVRPPWYRSGWAYLLYGIGLLALGLVSHQAYRVRRERKRAQKQARELKDERKAKKQLQRANQRLREANQLKEEFLANTSHELRTPLTNILGFVDVLRDTATEEQKQFLDAIEKNGRRLERTLGALIDLSRLRSESGGPELGPTEAGKHVHRIASDLRGRAEEKGLSLNVEVPAESIYAKGDDRYVEQILRNLVENAIKFTDEGHVTVSVEATQEAVQIGVEDTGVGINEAFMPELFEEFKQGGNDQGRSYEGYGLGLAISSRMAELMEADLKVESTKGEGSTFTLCLTRLSPPANERDTGERPNSENESVKTDSY